jgi:hypothetical protein
LLPRFPRILGKQTIKLSKASDELKVSRAMENFKRFVKNLKRFEIPPQVQRKISKRVEKRLKK